MLRTKLTSVHFCSTVLVYAIVVAATCYVAGSHARTIAKNNQALPYQGQEFRESSKPFFSLSTDRTYATNESARLWLDYHAVESLDFRVYRVNEPEKFFAQLSNPHQLGEREEEEIAQGFSRRPSLLERLRSLKRWAYVTVKEYVRAGIRQTTRQSFNHKFRGTDEAKRMPLNVADYARVPLLNPSQLVKTWREPLPELEDHYDRRMVPLGKQDSGVYLVEAVSGELRAYSVVIVSDLAMVQKTSASGDLMIYTVDRKNGEPRRNARVQVLQNQKVLATGSTNQEGVFQTKVDAIKRDANEEVDDTVDQRIVVFARQQEHFAISDLESFYFGNYDEDNSEGVRGYIYTDRPIYRPAQKVYFKGIVRRVDDAGRYRPVTDHKVNVAIEDSNSSKVFEKEISLSPHGTFAGDMDLSEEASLGSYQILVDTADGQSSASFEVAEYKKPEYKVSITTPTRFVVEGSQTRFAIDARYFFGSPVAGAEVQYYIYRSRYWPWYSTEEDSDESGDESDPEERHSGSGYGSDMVLESEGKLDAKGHLDVDFTLPVTDSKDGSNYEYRIDAQVVDSSRRTINGNASVIAARGRVIARVEPDRYVYTKGDTARIAVSSIDYEGHPVPASLQLKVVLQTWTRSEKKNNYDRPYQMHERELSSEEITTNSQGLATYSLPISDAGSIYVQTTVKDGGRSCTSGGTYIWVTSREREWLDTSYYRESSGSIQLIPDKNSYRPGETAHVLAVLPTGGANLLVTTELTRVMSAKTVITSSNSILLDVPIDASYEPNAFLNVTYVKDGDMYTAEQKLLVPARDKLLNLEIISQKKEYKPRETASYTVVVRNDAGAPVPDAEVSIGVVDEAIYSLAPETGSIRKEFYGMRYNAVETHFSRAFSFTGYAGEKPVDIARNKTSYQLADFKNESDFVEPMVRKQIKDTAFWEPNAVTGADGRATLSFRLPDNLTTWRATARAVTPDTKVGVGQNKVVARKDVIMRLETPRFVTQGDTVVLSGIVHNYLKKSETTQIALSVVGAQLLSASHETVTIGKEGEHRVDWRISAPQTGEIKLLAKALTKTESDAVELSLNVAPRGLQESRNESWGSATDNVAHEFSLAIDSSSDINSRRLRIEVTPSVAGSLFGALDYLTTFPYGCTEQTMSSFLPNVIVTQAVKDVRSASVRDASVLEKKVSKGRDRLYAFQHKDGGWGWWKNDQSDPFMTAYVVDGLTLARKLGYDIDEARLLQGREKLKQMLTSGTTEAGTVIDNETRAFMIYALVEGGDRNQESLEKLLVNRASLEPYGRALLALTLKLQNDDNRAGQVAEEIERSAQSDANTAHWQSRRKAMLDFAEEDDTEATALSLKALSRIRPDSPLLPKVARWLVSERTNGYYWDSTKNTAFAIYGLVDYIKISHDLTPDYAVEVYLNNENVLTERITENNASQSFVIERKGDAVGLSNQVRIIKRGGGSVYLTSRLDYYTDESEVSPSSNANLSVTREYFRLRVIEDGYNLKWISEPLTGEVRSGDLIAVRLRLQGNKGRHVMIEDPIPAGAEQIDNVGYLNLDYTNRNWTDWYSSCEFRDQRTVFFLDYFNGNATFQYAMRVQIPGEFGVAPARAELMYQPATHANTNNARFSFADRN
ncbi:MAG: alpha-2-macroglobulin [Pyrinomonadaceae bacterium]